MAWTRASSLPISLACPGSTVLPVQELRSPSTVEAGEWGTMVHTWKATGRVQPSKAYPQHARLFTKKLKTVWGTIEDSEKARLTLWPDDGQHELSIAYNCNDGSFAWSDTSTPDEWKGKFGNEWITGTMDYLGDVLGVPWTSDLKTGRFPPDAEGPQNMFYAAGTWLLKDRPPSVIASIDWWARYPVYNLPKRFDAEPDSESLDKFLWECQNSYRIHGRARVADDKTPFLVTGSQCTWCPSRRICPMEQPESEGWHNERT